MDEGGGRGGGGTWERGTWDVGRGSVGFDSWEMELKGGGGISICVAGRGVVRVGGGVFANGEKNQVSTKIPNPCS